MDWLNTEIWASGARIITLKSALGAITIFVGALVAAAVVKRSLDRLRRRMAQAGSAIYVAGQISRYLITFVGIVAAGSALGLDLSSLAIFAGAVGVGVGLGLQDIVRDFFSGLIILLDRSIEVGDFIELEEGVAGEVVGIGSRATAILTNDSVDVMIPNSMLISGKLTNWTRNNATRRVHIPFSVAYGSDKVAVRDAAIHAARSVSFTLPDTEARRTQVWLTGFGDSAMNYELVVWPRLEAVKRPGSMMAAYRWAIDDALREKGIEIPFPQLDLRLRSFFNREGDAALSAVRGQPSREENPEPARASINDAAREITEQRT